MRDFKNLKIPISLILALSFLHATIGIKIMDMQLTYPNGNEIDIMELAPTTLALFEQDGINVENVIFYNYTYTFEDQMDDVVGNTYFSYDLNIFFENFDSYQIKEIAGKARLIKNLNELRLIYLKKEGINVIHSTSIHHYVVDSDLCELDFTGKIITQGLSFGVVKGFFQGQVSMDAFGKYYIDSTRLINKKIFMGDINNFILFKSEDRTVNYGCGRSFEATQDNLKIYDKYSKTGFKYNLITDGCKNFKKTNYYNFVSSVHSKFGIRYILTEKVTCDEFDKIHNKFLELANNRFDFDNGFGWKRLSDTRFSPDDFIVIRDLLYATYGYILTENFSQFKFKNVKWSDFGKKTDESCYGTCYQLMFSADLHDNVGYSDCVKLIDRYIESDEKKRRRIKVTKKCYKKLLKEFDVDENEKPYIYPDDHLEWANNEDISLATVKPGTVVIDSINGDVRGYSYKNGFVTVGHARNFSRATRVVTKEGYLHRTSENKTADYIIFGEKPNVGQISNKLYVTIKGIKYSMTVDCLTSDKIYAMGFFKAPFGASGTPIFNDKGDFISLFSSTLTERKNRCAIKDIEENEDITSDIPVIVSMPNLSVKNYPQSKMYYSDNEIEPVRRVTMEFPYPTEDGYYELEAPMGAGKSTELPIKLARNHHNVLLIEPHVTLAKTLSEHLGFDCQTKGFKIDRGSSNTVVTAETVWNWIQDGDRMKLNNYDIVLLDEAHVESADMISLRHWFKHYCCKQMDVKVVAMSATFANSYNDESNYPIIEKKIEDIKELREIVNSDMNILMFTHKIKNEEYFNFIKEKGMKLIEYNSTAIKNQKDLHEEIVAKLKYGTGYAVVATKLAEVGFNENIDLVYTPTYDAETVCDFFDDRMEVKVSKVPMTTASFFQRRGRVGRTKSGIFVYSGVKPTMYQNPALLCHLASKARIYGTECTARSDPMITGDEGMIFLKKNLIFNQVAYEQQAYYEGSLSDNIINYLKYVNLSTGDKSEHQVNNLNAQIISYLIGDKIIGKNELMEISNDWDKHLFKSQLSKKAEMRSRIYEEQEMGLFDTARVKITAEANKMYNNIHTTFANFKKEMTLSNALRSCEIFFITSVNMVNASSSAIELDKIFKIKENIGNWFDDSLTEESNFKTLENNHGKVSFTTVKDVAEVTYQDVRNFARNVKHYAVQRNLREICISDCGFNNKLLDHELITRIIYDELKGIDIFLISNETFAYRMLNRNFVSICGFIKSLLLYIIPFNFRWRVHNRICNTSNRNKDNRDTGWIFKNYETALDVSLESRFGHYIVTYKFSDGTNITSKLLTENIPIVKVDVSGFLDNH